MWGATCSGTASAAQLREGEHEREDVRLGELGVGAQAAVHGVEGAHDLQGDLRRDVAGHVRIAVEVGDGEAAAARGSAEGGWQRFAIGGMGAFRRAQRQERRAVGGEELSSPSPAPAASAPAACTWRR